MRGNEEALAILGGGLAFIFWFVLLVLTIVGWWKILRKAGYPGALSLLWLVPVAGYVMFLVVAFSEWPIHRKTTSAPKPPEPAP